MKTDIQKIKKLLGLSGDEPLTPEEKRLRAKFVIYPLFFLMFAGAILLIYAPTQKEREEAGKGLGFNTEIPSPEETRMEGNKVSAYERDALAKKERKRKDTFQEMSELFNRKRNDTLRVAQGGVNVELPSEPEAMTPRSPVRSSTEAYRNMNRSLHTIHEPRDHPQDKELLRRIESLEKRQSGEHPDGGGQSLEEKMALMEKSYELAARYNGKRNTGFHTPVGKTLSSDRNTIAACVHGTQTVSDGQALRLRLLEPMAVDDRLIPKGTLLTGSTRIQGERLDVLVETVEYKGAVIPVELEVYDADGGQGILVPNSLEYDAVREIAANMGTSMGSSINISTDAGAQIASDVGKGVIQGVSQYVTKRMRTVKITLKAGHRLLLHTPE